MIYLVHENMPLHEVTLLKSQVVLMKSTTECVRVCVAVA